MKNKTYTPKGIDTGQLNILNKRETIKSPVTKLEILNSGNKQKDKINLNNWNNNSDDTMLINEVNWKKAAQNKSASTSDQSQVEYIEKMKGINIHIDKYKS